MKLGALTLRILLRELFRLKVYRLNPSRLYV